MTTKYEVMEKPKANGIDQITYIPAVHGRGFDPKKLGDRSKGILFVVEYHT